MPLDFTSRLSIYIVDGHFSRFPNLPRPQLLWSTAVYYTQWVDPHLRVNLPPTTMGHCLTLRVVGPCTRSLALTETMGGTPSPWGNMFAPMPPRPQLLWGAPMYYKQWVDISTKLTNHIVIDRWVLLKIYCIFGVY